MKRFIFLLAAAAILGYLGFNLLAGDPIFTTRIAVESAVSLQEKKFYNCACESERDKMMDIMETAHSDNPAAVEALSRATWDFSDLNYELIEKHFRGAIVHVSGNWSVKGDWLDEGEYIDLKIRLIKEYGRWKVCGILE